MFVFWPVLPHLMWSVLIILLQDSYGWPSIHRHLIRTCAAVACPPFWFPRHLTQFRRSTVRGVEQRVSALHSQKHSSRFIITKTPAGRPYQQGGPLGKTQSNSRAGPMSPNLRLIYIVDAYQVFGKYYGHRNCSTIVTFCMYTVKT